MPEFFFNGERVEDEAELMKKLAESQDFMVAQEKEIAEQYKVSGDTASAICYLRTRSRWTIEKEALLVARDRAGDPISLGAVLSGEF